MAPKLTLDEQLCFALYGASMAIGRAYKPLLDGLGLTYPQYLVLSVLWESGESSVGAIAERLALEPSTVTPLVKRLEAAGLVERRRSTSDERQVLVQPTAEGSAMRQRSRCLAETLTESSGMSATELARLNEAVRALRDAVAGTGDRGAAAGKPARGARPAAAAARPPRARPPGR